MTAKFFNFMRRKIEAQPTALTADGDFSDVDYPRGPISPVDMRSVHVASEADSNDALDHWEPELAQESNRNFLEPVVFTSTSMRIPPFLMETDRLPTETAPSPPSSHPLPTSDQGQAALKPPPLESRPLSIRDRVPVSSKRQLHSQECIPPVTFNDRRYTFKYELGSGLYSRVLYANRTKSHGDPKPVAVKVFHKSRLSSDGQTVHKLKSERVVDERNILEQITRERLPFLGKISASFQDENFVYLVMPLCMESLQNRLNDLCKRDLPMQRDQLLLYAAELLIALEGLHGLGYYHLDIKPANIMISGTGHIQLVDFGISMPASNALGHIYYDEIVGTQDWMAPEIMTTRPFSGSAADIWCYGLVLFSMFQCPHNIIFHNDPRHRIDICQKITPAARDLVFSRLLVQTPKDRYSLQQIKTHKFFEDVDFTLIKEKRIYPLYRPRKVRRRVNRPFVPVPNLTMSVDPPLLAAGIPYADR
ncbi:kinase-like domain-containing protein [Desarmillaria tabescens]|uniref:Kinase-like domain-containing protein n=1 Tax=Armillaria tabescens TaxID=1929756 RepID=A0AA39N8Y0_ARMTA|nr:kinase-like domain-containing protein [Desarmillaria tabescens]KAK0461221.1 kinase-like domain-containing protein [Desarmillaria tabescens]